MNTNNYQSLDILQLLAFYIQLKNIEKDQKESQYIHGVIRNIEKQIEKLHQENDILMMQNKQILSKLK